MSSSALSVMILLFSSMALYGVIELVLQLSNTLAADIVKLYEGSYETRYDKAQF